MSRSTALAAVLALAAFDGSASRIEAPPERAYSSFSADPARGFDFWIGEWDVNLREFQDGATFKDSVAGRASVYSILGGKAILELCDSTLIQGLRLAHYDPLEKRWVLWLDWAERNHSQMQSLGGGFRHGRGEFLSTSSTEPGQTVLTVHSFTDITPFSLRWDDTYSTDDGKTWMRNWVMEFTRTAIEPRWPIRFGAIPTYVDGGRCDDDRFRPYELLVGKWRGERASFDVLPVLDGCAVMGFLEDDGGADEFVFITYDSVEERWVTAVLDALPETGLVRYTGSHWSHLAAEREGSLAWVVWNKPGNLRKAGARLLYRRGDRALTLERVEDQAALGRFE